MPDAVRPLTIPTGRVRYASWKGVLLAQLVPVRAGLRVTELSPHDRSGCDLLVEAADGTRFYLAVQPYASFHSAAGDPSAEAGELRVDVPQSWFTAWRQSGLPVIVLLIDVDSEHGRYRMLDDVPSAPDVHGRVAVAFPAENQWTVAAIETLLEMTRNRPAVGRTA